MPPLHRRGDQDSERPSDWSLLSRFETRPICSKVKVPSVACVHMCVCIWNCGENIHQKEVGLSGEVGFEEKGGHDFVVRRILGILGAKYQLRGGAVGVCKRGCVCRW